MGACTYYAAADVEEAVLQWSTEPRGAVFAERLEYREGRGGPVTCALINYIGPDFPRGPDGAPKDAEVAGVLEGAAA